MLIVGGCGGEDLGPSEGELDGSCLADNTCNAGLSCIEGVCDLCRAPLEFDYVIDGLELGDSVSETSQLGFDVDGNGRTENALGGMIRSFGLDLQSSIDVGIDRGDLIELFTLEAADLSSTNCAAIRTYKGDSPSPTPCVDSRDTTCRRHLNGTGSFAIAADTPFYSRIYGSINAGAYQPTSIPATSFVVLSFVGTPFVLSLRSAKVAARISDNGVMSGGLGGGIPAAEVVEVLIPHLAAAITLQLLQDCTPMEEGYCNCARESRGANLVHYDRNGDCTVQSEELADNALIRNTILNPDLDLLDTSGLPGSDGIPDHLSFAVGFSAVSANF